MVFLSEEFVSPPDLLGKKQHEERGRTCQRIGETNDRVVLSLDIIEESFELQEISIIHFDEFQAMLKILIPLFPWACRGPDDLSHGLDGF